MASASSSSLSSEATRRTQKSLYCLCSNIFNNMDSFHVHLNLSNLKRLGNVFRLIEVCVFFIFVSRVISFQFQFQVGEYAKRLFSILLSHRFVFVIGNVIVITLFAKSGRDSHPDNHTPQPDTAPSDPHKESFQKIATHSETKNVSTQGATFGPDPHMHSVTESIERNQSARVKIQSGQDDKIVKIPMLDKSKPCFKRSYSECLDVENYIKPRRILRRTATEGCHGAASGGRCDEVEALEECGDGMSNEEFRVMVETFIAKQQRSLREEEKCSSLVN